MANGVLRAHNSGARDSRHRPRAWPVHLLHPVGFPTDSPLSVQLPAGDYQLSELSDILYELHVSDEYSLVCRVSELGHLRARGMLVIEGIWP